MIEVRGLSKNYVVHEKEPGLKGSLKALFRRRLRTKTALASVNLDVGEGEILGLVGPNGAGKTTLVKILAGIVHPTSGSARVLGHTPWERADAFRRQIALIMGQKAQLWWDLPAADGFLLLREIYGLSQERYQRNLDELCDMLGIRAELKVQVRRLSLGERMKMELIAALLHEPKVVFLDEPTIGLDLTAQRAIRDFLLAYRERHRPAMILTSHYMEDIERLCERIVIIRAGEFVYDGRLQDVVRRYAPRRVLTAHLRAALDGLPPTQPLEQWGQVLEATPGVLRMAVLRDQVAAAAAAVLKAWPVQDLSIDEEDVGTIIERIFRERGRSEP